MLPFLTGLIVAVINGILYYFNMFFGFIFISLNFSRINFLLKNGLEDWFSFLYFLEFYYYFEFKLVCFMIRFFILLFITIVISSFFSPLSITTGADLCNYL